MSELIQKPLPEPEDFDFSAENLKKLYSRSTARYSDPELWDRRYERIREEILFADVVEDLTGKRGHAISCPFHGTDSRPSFYVYPPSRGNMGYCFGCSATYTHVSFVSKLRGISSSAALDWLERTYELPPLESTRPVEEEDKSVPIEFQDLSGLYINFARREVTKNRDFELAEDYLRIYFEAEKEEDKMAQVRALGQVLGREALARVRSQKLRGLL